jgi:hypothetical protein
MEVLQAYLLSPADVLCEFFMRTEKMPIATGVQRAPEVLSGLNQRLLDSPFTGFDNDQRLRLESTDGRLELLTKAPFVAAVVELPIVDRDATSPQMVAEMSHGGQERGDAGFVSPNVG